VPAAPQDRQLPAPFNYFQTFIGGSAGWRASSHHGRQMAVRISFRKRPGQGSDNMRNCRMSQTAIATDLRAMTPSTTTADLEKSVTVVLVHGAWANASSWDKVISLLLAKGQRVVAVPLPLTSLEDDLAATNRIVADTEGPIVLVGHSWGGMAVTQAGDTPKVAALVYISAFAPDVGECGGSLIGAHPAPPALSTIVTDSAGFVYQTVDGMLTNIAPDAPAADARVLAATQGRLAGAAFAQTIAVAAWKTKPSWFIVTADDRVVSPELQAASARRMQAKTIVIHSSHMSLLSHPSDVASVIEDAVATVLSSSAAVS
jgi:pimeloyl-ACP methyl ester carboxylesterase